MVELLSCRIFMVPMICVMIQLRCNHDVINPFLYMCAVTKVTGKRNHGEWRKEEVRKWGEGEGWVGGGRFCAGSRSWNWSHLLCGHLVCGHDSGSRRFIMIMLSPRMNSWFKWRVIAPGGITWLPNEVTRLNEEDCSVLDISSLIFFSSDCSFFLFALFLFEADSVTPPFAVVLNGTHLSTTSRSTRFMCLSNATGMPSHTPLTPTQCLIHTRTPTPSQRHNLNTSNGSCSDSI